jgi:hypothetical protein
MFEFFLGHSIWAFRNGEFVFARGWPLWLMGLAATLGLVAIVGTLLWRRQLGLWRAAVVALLQFAFLTVLLLLLWRPVLNVERIRERENVVAVLVDNSASMNVTTAAATPSWRQQATRALQAGTLAQLAASSELRLFAFSDQLQSIESLGELADGTAGTRIGDALQAVTQMASSVPLAAVVLVSDGAESGGTLGESVLAQLAATGIPLHTVGVGPEQLQDDLELEQLEVPRSGGAGETLRAVVSVRHQGQRSARVRIYDREQLIAAQEIALAGATGLTTATLEFPAGTAGLRDLRVVIDPARNEVHTANNVRRALVEVDDRRRAILYLEGEPRWEYKFIRRAVEGDQSLRLVSAMRATPNRYYRQGVSSATELESGFASSAAELFAFDAVLLGSLEAAALSREQHEWLREFVDRRGGSVLLLAGRDGLGDGGWSRVPLGQVLPAALPSGATRSFGALANKVRLTDYGRESSIGRLHADPARNAALWQEMPALADFQSLGRLRPGAVVLLETVAGDQTWPLLAMQRYGAGATWLLGTGSTWRWQMRLPSTDLRHETFWRQLLHAVATPASQPVTLQVSQGVHEDTTAATLDAQVLTAEFRPAAAAAVKVEAVADDGSAIPVAVQKSADGAGRYTAMLQLPAPGLYRATLAAEVAGKPIGAAVTHLRREDGVAEQFGRYQHRAMLERLARETNGRYWKLDDLAGLAEAIRYSRAGMIERQTLELWNVPLAFTLLVLLKGIEWLTRRHWGRL